MDVNIQLKDVPSKSIFSFKLFKYRILSFFLPYNILAILPITAHFYNGQIIRPLILWSLYLCHHFFCLGLGFTKAMLRELFYLRWLSNRWEGCLAGLKEDQLILSYRVRDQKTTIMMFQGSYHTWNLTGDAETFITILSSRSYPSFNSQICQSPTAIQIPTIIKCRNFLGIASCPFLLSNLCLPSLNYSQSSWVFDSQRNWILLLFMNLHWIQLPTEKVKTFYSRFNDVEINIHHRPLFTDYP